MKRVRVIPLVLIDNGRAVVTRKFKNPVYIGDPLNAIKIFNDKEVDELIILDITKKGKNGCPDFDLISKMASESFMPLAYGGHVPNMRDAESIVRCGIEKICFNTALFSHPEMVSQLSARYGKQSIIASVDFKKNWLGKYEVRTARNREAVRRPFSEVFKYIVSLGVGEILLNSIDRDGCRNGYELDVIQHVSKLLNVPVIACGGAATVSDFKKAIRHGASAAAAAATFYFKGDVNGVLINYPSQQVLTSELYDLPG
jgi:cyclase